MFTYFMQTLETEEKRKPRVLQFGRDLVIARCIITRPSTDADFDAIAQGFVKTDNHAPLSASEVASILRDGKDSVQEALASLPRGLYATF